MDFVAQDFFTLALFFEAGLHALLFEAGLLAPITLALFFEAGLHALLGTRPGRVDFGMLATGWQGRQDLSLAHSAALAAYLANILRVGVAPARLALRG
jgi:hypothetical protein